MSKRVLGRGLSSLLREELVPVQKQDAQVKIDVDYIHASKSQPRKHFDQNKIEELANSISRHGVLQPILVKKIGENSFEIIAGERRFRASQSLGLAEVPVIIKDFSEREVLEIALIENIQRQELNVVEEAAGYQRLVEEFGYSQQQISESVGKSRSHIANLLRINQLDQKIKQLIIEGKITMGHARCLIGHQDALFLAQRVIDEGLSVRELERIVSGAKESVFKQPSQNLPSNTNRMSKSSSQSQGETGDDLSILAQSLSEKFGVQVTIENSNNVGKIAFHYNSLEELDAILTKID